jgi:hypothetical protein
VPAGASARLAGEPVAKKKNKKDKKGSRARKGKKSKYTAETADRHELYQLSVQASSHEVDIFDDLYKRAFDKKALSMREDFCGTALLCATWVKSDPQRTAVGVDLDEPTLEWGRKRNIEPLGEEASRVTLLQEDVRAARSGTYHVINALNFSYSVFRTRAELGGYFKRVRESLEEDGLFLLDAYGGWEAQEPMLEPREISGGFTYIWDQHAFDPITHEVVNHIHFKFKDGTKMDKAFTYEWRYWTLPEIQELLDEAGFSDVRVYWDQAEDEEEEDYRHTKSAENQPGWLSYLVALK